GRGPRLQPDLPQPADPSDRAPPSDRAGRARRPEYLPGDRAGPGPRDLLLRAEPGEEGRLPGVLRRDRPALRPLQLPERRPIGLDRPERRRSPGDVQADWRRGLRRGPQAARGLDAAGAGPDRVGLLIGARGLAP